MFARAASVLTAVIRTGPEIMHSGGHEDRWKQLQTAAHFKGRFKSPRGGKVQKELGLMVSGLIFVGLHIDL